MPDDTKKSEEKKEIILSPDIPRYLDEWTKNPKSKVFVKLAEEYRKGGLLEEALHVCEKGLQENPNYLSGNMVLAKIYFDMSEYDKSMQEVLKVTNAQGDNLMAQNLLLNLYIKENDKDGAIRQCDIISFLDTKNEDILEKKAELEEHGIIQPEPEVSEPEEEAETAKEVEAAVKEEFEALQDEPAEEEPEKPAPPGFATNTIAELYIKQGYYEKGLNIYKELLEESPNEPKLIEKINEIESIMHTNEPELVQEEIVESVEKEDDVEESLEAPIEEKEEVAREIGDSFDEPALEIVKEPETIPQDDEASMQDTIEIEAEDKEEIEQPERSFQDKQIERLENWLGKIQSGSGR